MGGGGGGYKVDVLSLSFKHETVNVNDELAIHTVELTFFKLMYNAF
jgi:hypothetical protein